MTKQIFRKSGFTLVELAMILVVAGILIGAGLPIARTYIEQYKHTQDRSNIQQLKSLLSGYMMSRGGLPNDTGNIIPVNNIGMIGINSYSDNIQYYANALLTEAATTQNLTTLCDVARNILNGITASTSPAICNTITDNYLNCADSTVMAFVLVSTGRNHSIDHENGDGDSIFENPSKKPNASNNYDDVVAAYGLPQLVNECQGN